MTIQVEVENVSGCVQGVPEARLFTEWVALALEGRRTSAELCVRLVDEAESASLNWHYRQKDKATNVLSFPSGLPEDFDPPILGDLAICAQVVAREAVEQGKTEQAHWAHLVIHGTLHLLGFDHVDDSEADVMEAQEIALLSRLGYANPYA